MLNANALSVHPSRENGHELSDRVMFNNAITHLGADIRVVVRFGRTAEASIAALFGRAGCQCGEKQEKVWICRGCSGNSTEVGFAEVDIGSFVEALRIVAKSSGGRAPSCSGPGDDARGSFA
jgi:hypothetical protein